MLRENRPHGLVNIFENLKKQISKKDLQIILDELADEEILTKKVFQKFLIYYANQDKIEVNEGKVQEVKDNLERLRSQKEEVDQKLKSQQEEMKFWGEKFTNEEIEEKIKGFKMEIPLLQEEIEGLQQSNKKVIPPEVIEEKAQEVKQLTA